VKKWHEIGLSGVSNFSIALVISGIVAVVIEERSTLGAASLVAAGLVLFVYAVIQAKKIEER
jgi:hypothetical protein